LFGRIDGLLNQTFIFETAVFGTRGDHRDQAFDPQLNGFFDHHVETIFFQRRERQPWAGFWARGMCLRDAFGHGFAFAQINKPRAPFTIAAIEQPQFVAHLGAQHRAQLMRRAGAQWGGEPCAEASAEVWIAVNSGDDFRFAHAQIISLFAYQHSNDVKQQL